MRTDTDSVPLYFPPCIADKVGTRPYTENHVGCSGSRILEYSDAVLKIEALSAQTKREHEMLLWLDGRLRVPRVQLHATENGMQYLLMSRLLGRMSCDAAFLSQPKKLAQLLARAAEQIWATDRTGCPYRTTLDERLAYDAQLLRDGNEECLFAPITYGKYTFPSSYALYEWLCVNRPITEESFTHGDLCLPNIFFDGDGTPGFLDLGQAGISDRNYDLAMLYHSLLYNYKGAWGGPVYPDPEGSALLLFDALGVKTEFEVLDYYVLLDRIADPA